MLCYSAAAGSCAEHNEMQEINYNVGRPTFLWMHGDIHQVCNFTALACLQWNPASSVVTQTACGILMSLFSHAEWFVFCILENLWDHYLLSYLCMQVCILHDWWFAYYLCVWAVSCVCWRGVWEGHHCGRMEIPNSDLPALFVCHCCLSVPYSYFFPSDFLFTSFPSCEDLKVFFPPHPPVFSWNMSLLLHTTLGTSDTHLEYHHHISSIFFFE